MAKTGHPNFVYVINSPWRSGLHEWSLTGNHSGASFDAADAQSFMEGTTSPFATVFGHYIESTHSTVVRSAYYNGQDSAPIFAAEYNVENPVPTPLVPLGDAYLSEVGGQTALEVCCVLEAQVGLSSKSKPVYARKYIHAVPSASIASGGGGIPMFEFSGDGAAFALNMGNGSWFGGRVYITPSGRQPTSNDWVAVPEPGNHQMPRGRKKKTSSSAGAFLLSAAEKAALIALGYTLDAL